MSEFVYDHRWCAAHGIGRFASEVRRRLKNWADVPLTGSPTSPTDPVNLAACLARTRARAFFSPGFNVPAWANCPIVSTVHDLIHIHFPGESSALKQAYYRFVQRPMVRRSPVTLTVSEFSRQQIVDWYGIPEDRVVVVGNGVSSEFTDEGAIYNSDSPYFLYVGNAKPHKNLPTLLNAFALVAALTDCKLILATPASHMLDKQLSSLPKYARVEVTSGLSDGALAQLYRGATALVLPSFYEGFGLPLVEAMACACPVIAAHRTSIPEVLAGAGQLFDPEDIDGLAQLMKSSLSNPQDRAATVRLGLQRASAFRWSKVARRVHKALERVIDG